jgi:hypothetical protein
MKIFALKAQLQVALFVVWLSGSAVLAQAPATGAPTSINTAFVKLFAPVGAFTAKVEAQVFDESGRETVRMPLDFALLDGKVRIEINVAQIQAKSVPPSAVAKLKQAGMDRVISVFRPDKKANYYIYPAIQSYVTKPFGQTEAEAAERSLDLAKSAVGKETIEGHPCVKNKAIVTSDQWPVLHATTWNATDLKDFPLQIEIKENRSTARMRFTQVRFVKPAAAEFDPPANYSLMK